MMKVGFRHFVKIIGMIKIFHYLKSTIFGSKNQLPEEIRLDRWAIYEVTSEKWPNITQHFVGFDLENKIYRISSPIEKFNYAKMIGISYNGRLYRLTTKYGLDSDGRKALNEWIMINKITNIIEVLHSTL